MIKHTKNFIAVSLAFWLICTSIFAKPVQANVLVVASDEWCPYICDDTHLPGFLVEIVNEIAASNGIKVKFALTPLAKALDLTQKGKVDILLGLTSQHINDFTLQKSRLSFGGLYNDFYVRANNPWRFQSITDLAMALKNNAILGTINGYEYGDNIGNLLKNNAAHIFSASGNSPLQKQLKMLQLGRLDILLDSRFTVQYQLSKLASNSSMINASTTSESTIIYAGTEGDFTPLFLGFSPLLSKELIQLFDNELINFRENGRLNKILAKYGLRDWHQQSTTERDKTSSSLIEG
ncbi:substrate-binding periplasmic protein [Colwellia psychrerythraea]|uniref:ABC-type transporter, periplasmic subunit family 3 n=1 Tax=Colwellia psychrerythraea TaxID=28229 RepID=A0A099KV13_COLPS|nr:transporter substrate-binding domain-containing protein [Colwellia psychrerythraea]KGJ94589.1 ABC-type transporter, periplasmic subunit family 3 [Colwellia psychrerythraea]